MKNKELDDILRMCLALASFLEKYSLGHIHTKAQTVKNRIIKYINDEEIYNDR